MKNKQINSEIEIRFHTRGMFNKGVQLDVFKRIKSKLDEDSHFTIDNKSGHKTTTLQGSSSTRLIVNNVTNKQIVQQKQKVKHYDIKEYNFRISEANEKNIEVNTTNLLEMYKNPSSIREKHRYTYVHSSKLWKVDITKVVQNNELFYEIELEFLNVKGNLRETANVGNSLIIKLLQLCQNSDNIVSNDFVYQQLQIYSDLLSLKKQIFVGPLPFTISKEQFNSGELSCGYSVTDKADGTRVLLFTNANGEASYVTRSNMFQQLTFVGHVQNVPKNTVIDCELINNTFYAFDVLVHQKVDVRERSLPERLETISSIKNPSSSIKQKYNMVQKSFYISDIYTNAHDIWKNKKKFKYELDGLIFTPLYQRYNNNNIYKWKPNNTIDFYIEKQTVTETNSSHETWKLHIASFDKQSKYQHTTFNGINSKFYHKFKSPVLVEAELFIPKSLQYATVSRKIGLNYPDKSIIEMKFVKDNWVPVKHREDKIFANGINAVNDAWVAITNPITLANIKKGVNAFCGRKFHNSIKDHLIGKYMKNKIVLDIGSGAGGDISKYLKHKINQVVGIDIVNVEYNHDKTKMRFYKANSELYRIQNIIKNDKVKQFEIVNCQFALHYFFKNDKTLDNFILNLNENLKKNGIFVTTFIDGNSLLSKVNNAKYKTNIVDIKVGKLNNKLTGNKVSVALKGTKYFKQGKSNEYIVKSDQFIEKMAMNGFTVVENLQFSSFFGKVDGSNLMNEQDREYSFMHKVLVFKKN
jgi:hypothetical protein